MSIIQGRDRIAQYLRWEMATLLLLKGGEGDRCDLLVGLWRLGAIALSKTQLEQGDRPVCRSFKGDRIVRDLG